MRTPVNTPRFLGILVAALGSIVATPITAQTLKVLHLFSGGSDGNVPLGGLILSGQTLFGTTQFGGTAGQGSVFALDTDGTGFKTIYSFTGYGDGGWPQADLLISGGTLFGTASVGGSSGSGAVFSVKTNGTSFSTLHSFTYGTDGARPSAGLILSGNTLYGTTPSGEKPGSTATNGVVFAVQTDGSNFRLLHRFTGSDGSKPQGSLALMGSTLFGTTGHGGSLGHGTVFSINTNASGFSTLHSFTGGDGGGPYGRLILLGDMLYGTTESGGGSGNSGTVFALKIDGSEFRVLHAFTPLPNPGGTNGDGANLFAGLVSSGTTLYGTASGGGTLGIGTVFYLNADGTGFTVLHSFVGNEGGQPWADLVIAGNALYGTTSSLGSGGGTVFSLTMPPQLTIAALGASAVFTWPTNSAAFALQSTTNLAAPTVWDTNFPGPVVVNGQYAVTNPISGAQQFFRLSQ
jgi:uncharacterized repeat protein (TIGR03803 family)